MTEALKLPVGIEDFAEIRQAGVYYVDKTKFIEQMLDGWGKVNLYTRPRRFGKTLNMSMLNCFFSHQYAERADLFEGLSVWEKEDYRAIQGKYPVIFLSFADVKQDNYRDAIYKIKKIN